LSRKGWGWEPNSAELLPHLLRPTPTDKTYNFEDTMSTTAQITANRRNAVQSTGPKTIEGKSTASRNAIKHGVLSADLIILEESCHDLQNLRLGIYHALRPEGAIEEILVEKIINAIWRIRRLTKAEGEFLSDRGSPFGHSCLSQGLQQFLLILFKHAYIMLT
jgi:hypothetical protein